MNVPLLEVINDVDTGYETSWYVSGFNVANSGRVLNITIPSLWNTTVIRLAGAIGT